MPKNLPDKSTYQTLLKTVKSVLGSGLGATKRVVEYQRVRTYWLIGEAILLAEASSGGALLISENLYHRISNDVHESLGLDLTLDTLRRSVQFFKTYPVFPQDTPLTFTHYLALMRVHDDGERAALEKLAIENHLSSTAIKKEIQQLSGDAPPLIERSHTALVCERGEPYIYYLRRFSDLAGDGMLGVDCGFKICLPLGGRLNLEMTAKERDQVHYVRSVKTDEGYQMRLAARKRASLYTYAARVLRVVDGDTIDALIDVGFGINVPERFRLKSINAPENGTRAGQEATAFLKKTLDACPIIVVRTVKAEMYGRWLGDIFALPGSDDPHAIAAEGQYLNQAMLDEGLATLY